MLKIFAYNSTSIYIIVILEIYTELFGEKMSKCLFHQ